MAFTTLGTLALTSSLLTGIERFKPLMLDEERRLATAFQQGIISQRVHGSENIRYCECDDNEKDSASGSSKNDKIGDDSDFCYYYTQIQTMEKSKGLETQLTDSVFRSEPFFLKLFKEYNTAAVELLFSTGKDILRAKKSCLSDENFIDVYLYT